MDDNTLPDLDSDKTIEQVIFENRIFDKNVAHIITHNGIKSWFESSPFHRFYPETAMKNKCAFRKKTQNYLYNQETGVLRKYVKGVDGVDRFVEVVLELERQNKLIAECHSGLGLTGQLAAMGGHLGRDKCYASLSQRYFFPVMRERVAFYIKYCHRCQLVSQRKLEKVPVTMKSIHVPSEAWAQIGVDLIGPLKTTKNGYKYICTVVDYFTKFVEAAPLFNKTGEEVGKFLYQLITRYGIMKTTITDQGREFNNKLVDELFRRSGIRHSVTSSYHPQSNGMVEKLNHTIEDAILKCVESQEDWDEILDSVLFSIRISRHASTGISPFRMLYNKDPVLPFQYKDRLEQSPDAEPRDCLHLPDKGINDPIMEMVDMLEGNRNEIFEKACKNISKAQKVQARNYNKRNSAPGRRPLGINDKCLKKNMKAKSRKEKMLPKFTGPYLITGQTQGGFLLRNKYAHQLKRSVPASQLVRYYGVMPVEDEECVGVDSDASDSGSEKELHQSCQRSSGLVKENKQKGPEKKENTPIGGQIVIMATNDKGFSSSDESLIDVVTNGKISNPFGNIDVNEIPIEIVEDLYSDNSDADDELEVDEEIRFKSREKKRKCMPEQNMFDHNTLITSDHSDADEEIEVEIQKSTNLNSAVKFLPLDSEQRANAAHKMCVRLPKNTNSLQNRGVGMIFASEPVISIEAKPDGACLFNTISLLLTGSEVYSYMFRHAICNYIANPANLGKMRQHIPLMYSSGEEYIQKSRRRDPYSWGTDCEIFACSIMTGYDVMVYSNQRKWLIYSKIGKGERTTENAMYINNIQGNHFDPIFSAIDY